MGKTTSNKGTLKQVTYTMLSAAVVSVVLLSTLNATSVAASSVQYATTQSHFKDVGVSHFAYEAVHWAKEKGIVDGYADGRFGPNDNVTEGQFAKMVAEYFGLKDSGGRLTKKNGGDAWTDAYYNKLAGYGVPLNGYYDNVIRNQTVKRGTVAQALAYLSGYRMDLTGSINYLLENNITVGQNSAYKNDLFKYFGTQNDLSRAQVVAFLYRMDNNGLSEIGTNAKVSFKNDSGYSLNESASIAKKLVDKSLAKGDTGGNVVVKPVGPSKPTTPVKPPVVENKNIDSKLLAKFNGILGKESVSALEKRGYEVQTAKIDGSSELYETKNNSNRWFSIRESEVGISISYDKVDADIALKLYNYYAAKNNYSTKLTLKQMQNAGVSVGGKIFVDTDNGNFNALFIITGSEYK